jgi:hypothetical protein
MWKWNEFVSVSFSRCDEWGFLKADSAFTNLNGVCGGKMGLLVDVLF